MRRNAVSGDGWQADGRFLREPTHCDAHRRHGGPCAAPIVHGMNEPTHANESHFWDDVADRVLESRENDAADLTDAGIEAMLHRNDDFDAA
jgi:hypothetical protein